MPAKGKHRRPKSSSFTRGLAAAGTGGAVLAMPVIGATTAAAAPATVPTATVGRRSRSAAKPVTAVKAAPTSYAVVAGDSLCKDRRRPQRERRLEAAVPGQPGRHRQQPGPDPPGLKLTVEVQAEGGGRRRPGRLGRPCRPLRAPDHASGRTPRPRRARRSTPTTSTAGSSSRWTSWPSAASRAATTASTATSCASPRATPWRSTTGTPTPWPARPPRDSSRSSSPRSRLPRAGHVPGPLRPGRQHHRRVQLRRQDRTARSTTSSAPTDRRSPTGVGPGVPGEGARPRP